MTSRSFKYTYMSESKFDISKLMDKPIWQMRGKEFVRLAEFAFSQNSLPARQEPQPQFIYGIQNLAAYIGCCASTIYDLKRRGVLNAAIKSQIGKRIVFDGPLARTLAEEYQQSQREARRATEG